jgi:hypothetical protein
MAIFRGPNIVRTGLVLALDAADKNSYSGTGTNWQDLSGGGYNATMYGSLPFSNDGRGCFDFATVTGAAASVASLGFTFAANMVPTTGNFTLNFWVKNPPVSSGQSGLFSNSASGDGYRFGIGKDAVYWLIGPTYGESSVSFTSTLNSTSWYNVVAIFARGEATPQIRLYLNGVFQGSGGFNASQTAFSSVAPGIVRSPCCTPLFAGKLACVSVYSKSLTATEVLQNYNATKTRFGL